MSISHSFPAPPDHGGLRYGRAVVRSEMSGWLAVVCIQGEIDAFNAEAIGTHLRRVIIGDRPALLDLSSLEFLGLDGLRALWAVGDACAQAGMQWTVVTSHSVRRLLTVADRDGRLPAVDCMVAALDRLRGGDRRLRVV